MTQEEKAQKIVAQGGCCDGVQCHPDSKEECPCYATCPGGGTEGHPKNLKTCQDFLASLIAEKPFLLWEGAPKNATMLKLQREFFVPSIRDGELCRTMVLRETLFRAPQKTKAHEIASSTYEEMIKGLVSKDECISLIEAAILKREEELRIEISQGIK